MHKKRSLAAFLLPMSIVLLGAAVLLLLAGTHGSVHDQALSPKHYRFVALYSGDNQVFLSNLESGLVTAANEADAWVTLRSFSSGGLEDHLLAFEEAIAARVDGIITNVPSLKDVGRLIDRAALNGIPVVTIVDDIYGSQRRAYIGVDYTSFGRMAAQQVQASLPGGARIAVISYPLSMQTRECMQKIAGFTENLSRTDGFRLSIEHVTELDAISAYNLARDLLDSDFHFDSFFCIDETITLAVAQCLADRKLADETYLVGCGEANEAYDFLCEGVVDALLTENPYYIGSEAVASLTRCIEAGGLPYITNAEILVATADNLQEMYDEEAE